MGKSALPADHRLNLGVAGGWGEYPATEAARNADVILAIGARFNDLHTGTWIKGYVYNIPPTRLIQVDIDPEEMTEAVGGRGIRVEHPDQFGDAYREAIRSNTPTVIDVVINRDTGIPVTGTWQMPPVPEVQPTFGKRKVR